MVAAERILNRAQIGVVPICGQLNAVCQSSSQVVHEVVCSASVLTADKPLPAGFGGLKRRKWLRFQRFRDVGMFPDKTHF